MAGMQPDTSPRPLLIYDGDCGFCTYWVRYWQKLTGGRVDYAPYQEAAQHYPHIPVESFQKAIQYVAPDGSVASAAEASFLTLSQGDKGLWLALYYHLPGFAALTEWAYAFIARRRPFFHRVSRLLWGKELEPPRYDLMRWLFLRGIGLIYLAAFISFGVQAMGLIGSQGILPLREFTDAVQSHIGAERYWYLPMLFWFSASDIAIKAVCWLGAGLSVLLMLNILPRLSLVCLYILYLSLIYAGQDFMTYQWDIFVVETGFLALVMSFAPRCGIWLARWLIFRFMFMSGAVKLLSGDPNWGNLSALSYHFLTQPLPTPLAWYMAQFPDGLLMVFTALVFYIQLVSPFMVFGPRRMRFLAGYEFLALELVILLTGNYNFFNIQTMIMCLPLFDDAALRKIIPQRFIHPAPAKPPRAVSIAAGTISALIVFCSLTQMSLRFGYDPPDFAKTTVQAVSPLGIVNTYGLFAVMTTQRNEIILEGSDDGQTWKEYGFPYKPGDVRRAPPWNLMHQPRLDWQLWFAALQSPDHLPWFVHFLQRVLENSPPVMALMESNPFPDHPPRYVRASFYKYTFATPEEKSRGIWWDRERLGLYFPVASLTRPDASTGH